MIGNRLRSAGAALCLATIAFVVIGYRHDANAVISQTDVDGDGYTNAQEIALGEDPNTYCQIMRADVDGDHAVSILDLTLVAGHFTESVPPAPERYDQDNDNAISILDLTRMAQVFTQNVSACPNQSPLRDKLVQPFAVDSIWNYPVGTGATLSSPIGITHGNVHADEAIIVLKPDAPAKTIRQYTTFPWGENPPNRCTVTTTATQYTVPIPATFVLPNDVQDQPNFPGAFLQPDGHTITQFQPVSICSAGADPRMYDYVGETDIYGDGIAGSHGGSGLSALGGAIREGELTTTGYEIPHALQYEVNCDTDCSSDGGSYVWPALFPDGCAPECYEGTNPLLKPGVLLVLPTDFDLESLETEPARILARTLMHHGAYLVDSTSWDAVGWATEFSPDSRVIDDFEDEWGYEFNASDGDWADDNRIISAALRIVTNNTATTVGGGGLPLVPFAAPLAP